MKRVLYYFIFFLLSAGIVSCDKNNITKPDPSKGGQTKEPSEKQAPDYKVWINGVEATVHRARVQDPPFNKEVTNRDFGGDYAFVSFDVSAPAEIKILSENKELSNTVLLPAGNKAENIVKEAHSLSLKIVEPMQLIVEPDGKNGPLFLFANPVEDYIPEENDPNLIYFGPGEHRPENALIKLKSNQTLYIADGAVVHVGVYIEGDKVTVRGRGILSGDEFVWGSSARHLIEINNSDNVLVKDVILQGAATWSSVIRRSENINIENMKVVGSRVQNDDGLNPVNSRNIRIRNCFIRTDDDCLAFKGKDSGSFDVEGISVENCILWCDRARVFLLGHESAAAHMRDITFKDIDIVHFGMTPFLLEPGEEMEIGNIRFENIRLNGEGQDELIRLKPTVNQYMSKKVPGHIDGVIFKNITLTGKPGPYGIQITGADVGHRVRNVTFEGLTVSGRKVDENYSYLEIGNNVDDLRFKI